MRDEFARDWPYKIDLKPHPNGAQYEVYFTEVKPLPVEFSLALGDAIQCLRSSLDHLAYYLTWLHQGAPPSDPRSVAFPTYPGTKYDTARSGGLAVGGVDPGAQAVIENLQPFMSANPEDTLLWKLAELNNRDKHRSIVVTELTADAIALSYPIQSGPFSFHGTTLIPVGTRVVEDTPVGTIPRFDAPASDMNVQGEGMVDIAIQEFPGPPVEVFGQFADFYNLITEKILAPLKRYLGPAAAHLTPEVMGTRRSALVPLGQMGDGSAST
jgi:hypothetical protein